ncbi:MAG: alcohol dehydrogenase catalytic domain-containing protein [Bacillota bacterium]
MMMKAAIYRGVGQIGVESVPVPELSPGDLLLRVKAASICATDHKIVTRGHFKIPQGSTRVLGHELVGEIVAGSEAYADLATGMRVGVAPNVGCGRCGACVQGLDNLCPAYDALGITLDGALAEYVRIPAAFVERGNVVPVGGDVSDEEVALIEPASCVLAAHEAVGTRSGDRVLVVGAGPMGLINVLYARMAGAGIVVAVDPLEARRQIARSLGADAAVSPEEAPVALEQYTGGGGFDVVIVSVPVREAQEQAIHQAAVQGRIHLFAGLPKGAPLPTLDTNAIHYRQIMVTGTTGASARQYWRTAQLVAQRRLGLAPLVSQQITLEQVAGTFSAAPSPSQLKVVVHPGRSK